MGKWDELKRSAMTSTRLASLRFSQAILLILVAISLSFSSARIAIQPLGDFDSTLYPQMVTAIENAFPDCQVDILSGQPIPSSSFYQPRNRYRAEKILSSLDTIIPLEYDKIIGVLEKDISTTKGEYYDWGIFGLGNISDKSCVVSVFRLRAEGVTQALYQERVMKLVIHELGHTFGLYHCSNTSCILTDACGKISTIDSANQSLCDDCNSHIDMVFMLL